MRRLGVRPAFVFCLDDKLQRWLEQRGVSSFYAPSISYTPNASASRPVGRWNSPSFNTVVRMKTAQIDRITSLGYDVIFNDVDVVWHHDVRPTLSHYLAAQPGADVLFQQNWPQVEINPGFAYYRASIQTRTGYFRLLNALERYFDEWPKAAKESHFSLGDQEATNSILTCEIPGGLSSKKEHKQQRAYRKAQLLRHDLSKATTAWAGDDEGSASLAVRWYVRKCDGEGQNGVNVTYGVLPPVLFQTGDVIYGGVKETRARALLTHANFIKGWFFCFLPCWS